MTERKSSVMVQIPDLTHLYDEALRKYVKFTGDDGWLSLEPLGCIGYVHTTEGTFALLSEGVGGADLAEEEPFLVKLFGVSEYGESIFPLVSTCLWADDLLKAEVVDTINLADFIRTFGTRLDENFRKWNNFLTPIAVTR